MKKIYLTLIIAIIAGITLTGGDCEDSGTSGGTQNDPNVMVFSNLVVQEVDPNNGSFGGASPSALNLLLGLVDSSASTNKDVALVSDGLNPNGSGFDFSGDLVINHSIISPKVKRLSLVSLLNGKISLKLNGIHFPGSGNRLEMLTH